MGKAPFMSIFPFNYYPKMGLLYIVNKLIKYLALENQYVKLTWKGK